MSQLIVRYDGTGTITGWRYTPNDDYTPDDDELITDIDHRQLKQMQVNTDTTPPTLEENPAHEPPPTMQDIDRRVKQLNTKVSSFENKSQQTPFVAEPTPADQQAFENARQADDIQQQLNALYDMLTKE